MAARKLTLQDAENIATRGRAWTFRLEYHGTTSNGNASAKFWYATGRAFNEAIEVGWGAIGGIPQHQLIDWTELRKRVAEKLSKGYDFAPTDFVRMTAASIAALSGTTPAVSAPVAPPPPVVKAPPGPVAAAVAMAAAAVGVKYTKPPAASLTALGEPYSLIRCLKMVRVGSKVTGYRALDENGDEVLKLSADGGVKFATEHDVEVEFS